MKQFATITVIGKDKTGVVAGVTGFLFSTRANIEALEEQVTRGQFSMTIQASWKPGDWQPDPVRQGLKELAGRFDMEINLRPQSPGGQARVALFATREPHCLTDLLECFRAGRLKADPRVIVSNRRDLEPIARAHRVPFVHVPWENRPRAEERALKQLGDHEVDLVILARFMKILSPNFVWRYKNRIINVHPSLLPSFPGPQAYRQAYEHGVKVVGVTAHFVSMHLDEGPIIAQDSFKTRPGMTLKEMVAAGQKLESKVLVRAVRLFLQRRLDVYWGQVKLV